MRVSVIGTGYVGLVSGTCFSEMGNDVVCVDIDEAKVDKLTNGELTIFEPGLEVYFERNLREERLQFTTELAPAVEHADLIFLALPTPPGEDGSADLRYVLGVAENIGKLLAANPEWGYKVVVDKSTVPVGTAELVTEAIAKAGVEEGTRFDVVSNPEFLREGVAVDDFMKPERVVVGTSAKKAAGLMTQLYEPFVRSGNPIIIMDEKSAEMTKYAANALLATKITFMNEIANVCDRVGADVDKVRRGIGTDSRIGTKFLYAGIGFGGSCFPKDVQALVRTAQQNEYPFEILQAVLNVNETQRTILMPRIEAVLGSLRGKKIAMWGLAFKPNTDDVREASSHAMIRSLTAAGADVVAYDPEAIETTRAVLGEGALNEGSIHYTTDSYGVLIGADILVICTEWPEFRRPDFERLKTLLTDPIIFDGRNLYDHERMAANGFEYYSIGRPFVEPIQEIVVAANGQA
ncbi:MAG: UDP-glucose/GDP-mannose dehydrogenase family protein [Bacteroidota bacterium]